MPATREKYSSLSEKSRGIVDLSGVTGAEAQERVMLELRRCLVSCEEVEEALLLMGLYITQGGWGRRFKGGVGVTVELRGWEEDFEWICGLYARPAREP